MSDLKDDRQTLEKREGALEGIQAPLRDQLVTKLYKKLDEMDIAEKVRRIWTNGNSNRTIWTERQKAWLQSWDEHLVSDTSGPFDGSSNIHIPMPFTVCKTMHARFLQALWQDPPFNVKAQNEASVDNLQLVSDVLRFYVMRGANYNKGIERIVDLWVWDWITQGSGILKLRWDIQYAKYMDVDVLPERTVDKVVVENGVSRLVPQYKVTEKEVERIKKCFDGPVFDLVPLEDYLAVGDLGEPDLADSVFHRTRMTASELWTLVDRKLFNEDAVKEVIAAGSDTETGSIGGDEKQQRALNAGRTNIDNEQDLDRYEVLECYVKVDIDNSGINTDVVVWIHPKTGAMLRATYLRRISPKGRRPFAKVDFQPRKDQEFGIGMPELLYPLSQEMDAMHNMRIDFGMLSVMPFGFYRPSSGIDPTVIKFEPGTLIPTDNPQTDIYFPNLGNRVSFGYQEEAALQTLVERISSVSDLNLGLMNGQGATRTATGARALVGEMNSNLDVYLRRLNRGWTHALNLLLDMLQLRIPQGLAFRLTGDSGADVFRKINHAGEIYGDFDIEVSANSASSNPAIQESKAQEVLQLVSNPMAFQVGIVTPNNFYAAMENYLRARGIRDYGKYIQKPANYVRTYTPEEEAVRVLQGQPVPVSPEMDHQSFLELYDHMVSSDDILGQYQPQQIGLLKAQANAHAQMLQALQQMQAQQQNTQQMNINSSMGAQPGMPISGGPVAGESDNLGQ